MVFGAVWGIVEAVSSIGFTSCPTAVPGVNSTDAQFLPNHHVLVYERYQGSSSSGLGRTTYKKTNLFNPNVSNATPIGYWRTTKTWYLRSQWAYVLQGGNTPLVVAWQPYFSWARTFYLKRCAPVEEHVMTQDILWFASWWGNHKTKWSIADAVGTKIAQSEHSLVYTWPMGTTPNGWNSVVSSTLYPGVVIGTMTQKYNSWWVTQTTWTIDVNRTDMLKPYVLSFMAAAFHFTDQDN